MSEAAAAQAEEVRRILLNKHLDIMLCGPKRPGSAPPQAEVLPGSPMGPAPCGFNIITGEPLRGLGVSGGQQRAAQPPTAHIRVGDPEDLGLTADAEEALRSRPDYIAYYYANVRNNPRLPPPLTTRNVSTPWVDHAKVLAPDVLADAQNKPPDGSEAQAQATMNMLFGNHLNLKDGTEPIPIRDTHYLGQKLGQQLSSSLGAVTALSPSQGPDTLAAAWANIGCATTANSAAQHLDSLLGGFGSPKPVPGLSPLLTADLKAQASGASICSVRSADEQALHDSLYLGSTPHTPMGSQHGGACPLFGSFNPDSPRAPSMDLVGRSMSSNSLGGGVLGKDPKISPAPGPAGRIASVIGDQRTTLRTPSKLRIGSSNLIDNETQQQLIPGLTSADAAAAAAAGDPDNAAAAAAAAAAQQLASAAQMQAAVEAFQNLPTAFAAALGREQAGVPVAGQPLVPPDVLLAGTGAQQAMYMAAMYPMYFAQQTQQTGMHSFQAMQAAAMAGFPAISTPGSAFSMVPGGVPPPMLPSAYQPAVIPGLPSAAASSLFGTGAASVSAGLGLTDVGTLSAADLRPQHQFSGINTGSNLVQPYPSGVNGDGDYGVYYQKMLEVQAAAALAGGVLPKEADTVAAAARLRGGIPPPPPPPAQPPPPPKESKRNSGGEPHPGVNCTAAASAAPFGHTTASGADTERRLRGQNSGRDLGTRASGGINISASGSSGTLGCPQSPSQTHTASFTNPQPSSRLRTGSSSQFDGQLQQVSGSVANGGGINGGFASVNSVGNTGTSYVREAFRSEGPQRRNSQRRVDMLAAVEVQDTGGGGSNSGGGTAAGAGGRGPRSSGDTLLDEFKNNKTGRKYELREILGHVYEFSLDQHGSRFIQQKLEGVNPDDLDAAFSEVLPRILHLMTDVFGNYVVQKFLEHGSQEHRARVAKALHGHVLQLSLQMYGCRVVQKALEVFTEEQQVELVSELEGHIMRCVRDQNGNHVIQKCIECVPTHRIVGLLDHFLMCVVALSTHPFGCRIIQRILEHVRDQRRREAVMTDILSSAIQLTQDQYGNYVIQHVLERGAPEERSSITSSLANRVVQLSMHKFASNVIEKCLTYGSVTDRDLLINRMLGAQALQMQQAAAAGGVDGDMEVEDPVQAMMKDQFGNYVVQKVLEVCTDDQREAMLARVRQQLHALKRFTYGKHIVARVEKLLSAGTRYQTHAKGRLLPDDEALAAAAAAVGGRLGSLTAATALTTTAVVASTTGTGGEDAVAFGSGASVSMAVVDGSMSSDGGFNSQPPAPTTPPVSSGLGEGGYMGSVATKVQVVSSTSSDGGAAAVDRPCSGVVGLEKEESPEPPAVLEAH
ncbi:hypothetical protein VaNZ11_016789 [Volvox africanus]|uniref:PUM-HD domain-containing protein n=1 Tax=Volvox africanus TaxID=51714 RepID=A0ABQ5SNH0_9CHLO|nr:hypothetical protein VaNZ11_016789 [Volvox africanus]